MEEVLDIEKEVANFPWDEDEFLSCMRQKNCIGMVAEYDQKVLGFMIYELHKRRIYILNFAVATENQRKQIGTQMIQRLIEKLSHQRRKYVTINLRETNINAQLFFKNMEFKAVSVIREHYEDTDEDAYYMKYSIKDEIVSQYKNRISTYIETE